MLASQLECKYQVRFCYGILGINLSLAVESKFLSQDIFGSVGFCPSDTVSTWTQCVLDSVLCFSSPGVLILGF